MWIAIPRNDARTGRRCKRQALILRFIQSERIVAKAITMDPRRWKADVGATLICANLRCAVPLRLPPPLVGEVGVGGRATGHSLAPLLDPHPRPLPTRGRGGVGGAAFIGASPPATPTRSCPVWR